MNGTLLDFVLDGVMCKICYRFREEGGQNVLNPKKKKNDT